MEKEWSTMTREEKREERFRRWISPETEFESPEAADAYKERVTRLSKVLLLEERRVAAAVQHVRIVRFERHPTSEVRAALPRAADHYSRQFEERHPELRPQGERFFVWNYGLREPQKIHILSKTRLKLCIYYGTVSGMVAGQTSSSAPRS